ncbi:putative membrane protein [Rhodococcus opacus RKJ300 = JCM 13270]|uniref:Hypothetical membrane protein n=3 Tax=Nocardiaceae TaxID=85025 RepID=C1BCX6_RHOOB|nr:putative membrane protein [Rhodococcus opacus RKJ300 = JCM 13270]QQZ19209.1 DUF2269 domain-containing protein [Rhodococcus sp. 21391]BAH55720.1 hypothetical membrane protein [Rhodococcus opacus B4]
MTMSPPVRTLALTVHIGASAGWLGAIVTYLVVAAATLIGADPAQVRGGYQVMAMLADAVLLPLALASLVTGLICSLGTAWGLFRHYWVLLKLLLNLVATVVLVLYTRSIEYAATVAAQPSWSQADRAVLQDPTHLVHATAALIVVLAALVLAVYKPRGVTAYGHRKALRNRAAPSLSR